MNSILVIKIDEIGDVVLATAFLRELRANFPTAHIEIVVKPEVKELICLCPYIDIISSYYDLKLPFAKNRIIKKISRVAGLLLFTIKKYFFKKKDIAIIPRWDVDHDMASVAAFLSARKIVLYSSQSSKRKKMHNFLYDFLADVKVVSKKNEHEVLKNLNLITALGGVVRDSSLELWGADDDDVLADRLLSTISYPKKIIAVMPGAGKISKVWKADYYVMVLEWLFETYDCGVVIIGGQEEFALARKIQKKFNENVVVAASYASLRQTAAVIKKSVMYLGGDTGCKHIAAACKKPVFELSCHLESLEADANSSYVRFGAWQVPYHVVLPTQSLHRTYFSCRDSIGDINSISPQEAILALGKFISKFSIL